MAQITRQARLPVLVAIHAGLHGDGGALRRQVQLGGGIVTFGAGEASAGVSGMAENDVFLQPGDTLDRRGLCVAGLALSGARESGTGVLHRTGVALDARPFEYGVPLMAEGSGRAAEGEAGRGQK